MPAGTRKPELWAAQGLHLRDRDRSFVAAGGNIRPAAGGALSAGGELNSLFDSLGRARPERRLRFHAIHRRQVQQGEPVAVHGLPRVFVRSGEQAGLRRTAEQKFGGLLHLRRIAPRVGVLPLASRANPASEDTAVGYARPPSVSCQPPSPAWLRAR